MNFRLSEDEAALKAEVRRFCEAEITLERLRKVEFPTGIGFDPSLWKELSEMGVFGLRQPEAAGGAGLGLASAVLVFVELGRRLAPGPTIATHLASGLGADFSQSAAEGKSIVGSVEVPLSASEPLLIEYLEQLNVLLTLRPDGIYRLDPKSLSAEACVPLDPLTPVYELAKLPAGERIAGADRAQTWRLEASVLAAAELVGIAEATLELALQYSKTREQFGRPIGSFQALKHMMSDMLIRKEVARAAVYAAGATFDDPQAGDFARAAKAARITAIDAAMKNARACIQIYGGMGYTWEAAPHYYLKRAFVLDRSFA